VNHSLNLTYSDEPAIQTKLLVIAVGGAGGNAVNRMVESGFTGVEFHAMNTDIQALSQNRAQFKFQLGKALTKGEGTGAQPDVGGKAVEQDKEAIEEIIKDADLIFLTAGMGKGTGTGASPRIAKIAKELDILTVAIVTLPFHWEGKGRLEIAQAGIDELREYVDTLIVIPNQQVMSIVNAKTPMTEAYRIIDTVLSNATRGVSDLVSYPGVVNLDFADIKSVIRNGGDAFVGIGKAEGEERAKTATAEALECKMLEHVSIEGAQKVLVNITGPENITAFEVNETMTMIEAKIGSDAVSFHGMVLKEDVGESYGVTIIATGFDNPQKQHFRASQAFKKNDHSDKESTGNGHDDEVANVLIADTQGVSQSVLGSEPTEAIRNDSSSPGFSQPTRNEIISTNVADVSNSNVPEPKSGKRIHLEVDLDSDPPNDWEIPTFMRKRSGIKEMGMKKEGTKQYGFQLSD